MTLIRFNVLLTLLQGVFFSGTFIASGGGNHQDILSESVAIDAGVLQIFRFVCNYLFFGEK